MLRGKHTAAAAPRVLEAKGHKVCLIAVLYLSSHIRGRVHHVSWGLCLLHVSHFLGLCSEEQVNRSNAVTALSKHLRSMPRADAMCLHRAQRLCRQDKPTTERVWQS